MHAPFDPAPRRPLSSGERLGAGVFAVCLLSLLAAELVNGGDPRKLSVLFILLSWYPLIAVHELGHALVARAVGWGVHEIVLGFGLELLRLRVLGAPMTVRLIPAGGYVVPYPRDLRHARAKSAAIYAAGPLSELALAAGLVALVGPTTMLSPSTDLVVIALQSLAVAAVMGAVMNLLPTDAAGAASDGLGILLSMGTPGAHFRYRMAHPTMDRARHELDAGRPGAALATVEAACESDPSSPYLQAMRARCLAAVGRFDDAFALLEELQRSEDASDLAEATRLHAAARVALSHPEGSLLEDAEQACRAALARIPGDHEIAITHGEVLLALGRPARSFAVLQQAYNGCRKPALERRCLTLMAAAARADGRSADAERLLAARPKAR